MNYSEMIVDTEKVQSLKNEGFKCADLHVHTYFSHDVISVRQNSPIEIYKKAIEKGMDYIVFTDHNTIEAYDFLNSSHNFLTNFNLNPEKLIYGSEISILDKSIGHTIHLNVYDFNKEQYQEIKYISNEKKDIYLLAEFLKKNNIPFVYNHPFWFQPNEKPNLAAIPELFSLFPVVEYNMHRVRIKNKLACILAEIFNNGIVSTTDTHVGNVGLSYTIAKGDSFREYFDNITKRNSYIVTNDLNIKVFNDEIIAWLNLIFENKINQRKKLLFTGINSIDSLILSILDEEKRKSFKSKIVSSSLKILKNSSIFGHIYLYMQNNSARKILQSKYIKGLGVECL